MFRQVTFRLLPLGLIKKNFLKAFHSLQEVCCRIFKKQLFEYDVFNNEGAVADGHGTAYGGGEACHWEIAAIMAA